MELRIESLSIEDFRCFKSEHRFDFDQTDQSSIQGITGPNESGKTTVADGIQLCFTGGLRNTALLDSRRLEGCRQTNSGSGRITITTYDGELDRRFQFSRQFRVAETQRGPVNSVGPLQISEETDGAWNSTTHFDAMNTVFPTPAFRFCRLDAEQLVAIGNPNTGLRWSTLLETVGDAAAKQAVARGYDLPPYFADNDALGDEMLRRINTLVEKADDRDDYDLVVRDDCLVPLASEGEPRAEVILGSGNRLVISHLAAIVAGKVLPATPPLIGDSLFGRLDQQKRQGMYSVINQLDRQVILLGTAVEFEGLDISPGFTLERVADEEGCRVATKN